MTAPVRVQPDPFDMGAELNAFAATVPGAGAVVSFSGITRDLASGDLKTMRIEHYPGMTETALARIRATAIDRFTLADANDPAPLWRHGAGRHDHDGRHRRAAPRRCVPGGRVPDGLPEIPRAVLETGDHPRRRHMGSRLALRTKTP